MAIPIKYRRAGRETQINVDFIDFATGRGYKNFYFADTASQGHVVASAAIASHIASHCILTTQTIKSHYGSMESSISQAIYIRDWETTLDKTFVVGGDAYANLVITAINKGGGSPNTINTDVSCAIILEREGVETNLGFARGKKTFNVDLNNTTLAGATTLKIPLAFTRLRKGDKLKARVGFHSTGSATDLYNLGTDPAGRTDGDVVESNGGDTSVASTDWADAPNSAIILPIVIDI